MLTGGSGTANLRPGSGDTLTTLSGDVCAEVLDGGEAGCSERHDGTGDGPRDATASCSMLLLCIRERVCVRSGLPGPRTRRTARITSTALHVNERLVRGGADAAAAGSAGSDAAGTPDVAMDRRGGTGGNTVAGTCEYNINKL